MNQNLWCGFCSNLSSSSKMISLKNHQFSNKTFSLVKKYIRTFSVFCGENGPIIWFFSKWAIFARKYPKNSDGCKWTILLTSSNWGNVVGSRAKMVHLKRIQMVHFQSKPMSHNLRLIYVYEHLSCITKYKKARRDDFPYFVIRAIFITLMVKLTFEWQKFDFG